MTHKLSPILTLQNGPGPFCEATRDKWILQDITCLIAAVGTHDGKKLCARHLKDSV